MEVSMIDFVKIVAEQLFSNNRGADVHIYPMFQYGATEDVVCKGGEMKAFWYDNKWRNSIQELVHIIDNEMSAKAKEETDKRPEIRVKISYLNNDMTNSYKRMLEYFTKQEQKVDIIFDQKVLFADEEPKREDYSTYKLPYKPEEGDTPSFDKMFERLYDESEIEKALYFMGALLTNNMKRIQKFLFFYGSRGTGKGTMMDLWKTIFGEYWSPVDLNRLTGGGDFNTGGIREKPLLIDEDADISKMRNDQDFLKLTAHETVMVNEKYRTPYPLIHDGLVITASNQGYKSRNVDAGINRRAIVIRPSNEKWDTRTYFELKEKMKFETPMIANKAIKVFESLGSTYFEDYEDVEMQKESDHVFNFVRETYLEGQLTDPISLKKASELYKLYLEDIGWDTTGYKLKIKSELKRYYGAFSEDKVTVGNQRLRNVFLGFKLDTAFPEGFHNPVERTSEDELLEKMGIKKQESYFDQVARTYPAQEATADGLPRVKWDDNRTTLSDVDTSKLHYVRIPMNHIVIDFDKKNAEGEKDLQYNLEAARKFPDTYTELSKSGKGVHLHYIYDGDVGKLASLYEEDVEIKVFTGKSSLRRKLSLCNDSEIATITTGLPEKKEGQKVYQDVELIVWNEKRMRKAVSGNLDKRYHNDTSSSVNFIAHIFKEAEEQGIKYDLTDMRQDILSFAAQSSNQAPRCIKIVKGIKFNTMDNDQTSQELQSNSQFLKPEELYFYDIEVFSNLLVVVWKKYGEDKMHRMINPSPEDIEELVKKPLVGFNNRRYDNHILYARFLGGSLMDLYRQSQRIINKEGQAGFYSGAYELSYADIYEYSSDKKSLKKWEVELDIYHDEFELPWDKPVPENMWERVADYCENDVAATEAVFKATLSDYNARLILATLSGLSVNATTRQHAEAFLFGSEKRPQDKFEYTDLSEMFPGYKYEYGKSEYRGEDPSEGGYVYSEPGVYSNVGLFDVASMHPTSLIAMNYFGPYTERFAELKQTRIDIKHRDYDKAREAFNGSLKPYLEDEGTASSLAQAMKIIINIVYGLTSAKWDNKFRHPKNNDNIVAKRGALFMIDLKHAVQEKGYTVVHVKTDSIKVADADDEIRDFIFEFGKKYDYDFEHEATYDKLALVNRAVYIAKKDKEDGTTEWEAVGAQFAEPYVFKTLFTKELLRPRDYILTKQATKPIYLGDSFVGKIANVYASKTGSPAYRYDAAKDELDAGGVSMGPIEKEVDGKRVQLKDGKSYLSGTKGYLWKLGTDIDETSMSDVDMQYYTDLASDAVNNIAKVGDVREIIEDETVDMFLTISED